MPLQAQKMEVLGRLCGAVIHDLNNLLTVIQLNAGLLKIGSLDGDEVVAAAGKIEEASNRAADLTRKVLNFSRGQADETGAVNLQESIASLSRLLEPLMTKGVRIVVSAGLGEWWAQGNRGAIEQAIMNLVLNAVDAMPSGGNVTISFARREIAQGERTSCCAGKYVVISVADEGPGISPEDQKGIFQPFFTTKNSGTGMGLAIVNRIARLHGGIVEVESERGKGSEFRLWLPVAAPPSDNAPGELATAEVEVRNRTVLLVEDDAGIRDLARLLLESRGLRVLSAETGEEALKLWEIHRDRVDVLFTDIMLPGKLSGRDVALLILKEKPQLPVLYTSGYNSMGTDQSYFTKDNFLPKPFQPAALQKAIKAALSRA